MRLAIMQPYLFPYLGYFQLMHAADRFVVYDDVNFIKGGWINRNRIALNGGPYMFTLPLINARSNVNIDRIEVGGGEYLKWRGKFLRTLQQAYAKAPFRDEVIALVQDVLVEDRILLADLLRRSLQAVIGRLRIPIEVVPSSSIYRNSELSGAERVLDICAREKADVYVNAIGGKVLYSKQDFRDRGIDLRFIRSAPELPSLSIIDVMMTVPPDRVLEMLGSYDLE